MHSRFSSRTGLTLLEAILEGDVLFYRSEEDDDGAGGSGGGSSQEDDEDTDDDGDGAGGSDDDGDGGSDDDEDADDARVRRANRQAAKYRTELREAQKKLKTLEGASLSEKEKAERERDEALDRAKKAEQKASRIERERVVTRVATRLGFEDPDIVLAMVEAGRVAELDTDDDDLDEDDVKAALKALAKRKPHLLSDKDDSSDTGGDGRRGRGTNGPRRDRSQEDIEKLPPSQRAHARLMRAFQK